MCHLAWPAPPASPLQAVRRRRAKAQAQPSKDAPLWVPRTEATRPRPEDRYDFEHADIHQERENDAKAAADARKKEKDQVGGCGGRRPRCAKSL